MNRYAAAGLAAFLGLAIAGCGGGGGGGGGGGSAPPPPVSGTISGTAIKGPVSGATVTAYGIANGAMGSMLATATTDANGNFSLSMGTHAGAVMLQMTGGTFVDEATGTSMTMRSGDVMSAVLTAMTAGANVSGIQMTPLTTMAQAMAGHMAGGMTDANIAAANAAIGGFYMVNDILHTIPMNPLVSGSGSATQDGMDYGMTLAAMSQYAHAQGMSSSSAMVTAMQSDASDGVMDGMMSGSAVMMGGMGTPTSMHATAGTAELAAAMSTFIASPQNHSGVTSATMQALMDKLNGSDGHMGGSGGGMTNATMSGMVFDGSMHQATVTAYGITGGVRGAQITSTTTDDHGEFSMSLGAYAGPVMLQVSNGSYTDPATLTTMTMGTGNVMTAVMTTIASGSTVTGVRVTPMTSMAQARAQAMTGGMTDANIGSANTAVGTYFMMTGDILHTTCMDTAVTGSGGGASQDQRNCGAVIAAMSQYAKGLGMMASTYFVTAMMNDASDGTMNGMMGGSQISMGGGMMGGGMMQSNAGTSGLATSMTDFMGSAMNHSGLTAADMNALIQHLAASNGSL